jgi:hypothetical protein
MDKFPLNSCRVLYSRCPMVGQINEHIQRRTCIARLGLNALWSILKMFSYQQLSCSCWWARQWSRWRGSLLKAIRELRILDERRILCARILAARILDLHIVHYSWSTNHELMKVPIWVVSFCFLLCSFQVTGLFTLIPCNDTWRRTFVCLYRSQILGLRDWARGRPDFISAERFQPGVALNFWWRSVAFPHAHDYQIGISFLCWLAAWVLFKINDVHVGLTLWVPALYAAPCGEWTAMVKYSDMQVHSYATK